jgi:DNA-nicking Smr family endonuclease
VLDLHGMTLADAHRASLEHVYQAKQAGDYRYVTIITGLSGQICDEFPRWFENHSLVRSVKALRGGGAWEIWLKKDTLTQTR